MTTIESAATTIRESGAGFEFDEAQLAAVSFLARYSGRTLEAYRHDLRGFFQWATDIGIAVLEASRSHIELFRAWMEDHGLAASTIDRRLSTVCGSYRFAHIDGRIRLNLAQYVRRPQVHASDARGLDRSELGVFLFTAERYDRDQAALAVLLGLNRLRVSEACATNVEDLGFERGHRTLRIMGKGNKPATVPLVPRTARTIDLAVGERHEGPILRRRDGQRLDRRTPHRWVRSIGKRAGLGAVHPAHAAGRVHHGRPRRRRPAARRPDRRPSRRPPNHHHLPPAPPELRPPRRLRRGRLRCRRLTAPRHAAAPRGRRRSGAHH
jgi:integrase/recombinase XerD